MGKISVREYVNMAKTAGGPFSYLNQWGERVTAWHDAFWCREYCWRP